MKRPGGKGSIFELFPGHVGVRPRETKGGAARVDPAFQEPCHKGAEKPARAGGGRGPGSEICGLSGQIPGEREQGECQREATLE